MSSVVHPFGGGECMLPDLEDGAIPGRRSPCCVTVVGAAIVAVVGTALGALVLSHHRRGELGNGAISSATGLSIVQPGPAVVETPGLAQDAGWSPWDPLDQLQREACVRGQIYDGKEFRMFDVNKSPCQALCCKRELEAVSVASVITDKPPPPKGPPKRIASFMVIGDWGYDPVSHGWNVKPSCEPLVAKEMNDWMEAQGDVRFVLNVGDSFYPNGVANKADPQWQHKWRDVFSPKVRSVPWYSVYGNHDYHIDNCICTDDKSQCAQINADEKNLDFFVMPDTSYNISIPDLNMEIIGMDTNQFMEAWDHSKKRTDLSFNDCQWTHCKDTCWGRAKRRTDEAFDLFYDRMSRTTAKNLLVFSHYPTDYYVGPAPEFLTALRTPKRNITFFGGHRHSTDQWSTESIAPNNNWIVGGGGGWSCDSDSQGFIVGEVMDDFSVTTRPIYVDAPSCCNKR